jgi:protocatechuate 3,4-dioxygenase beta subunit
MQRKEFLRKGLSSLGMFAIVPLVAAAACSTTTEVTADTTTSGTGSTNGSSASNCSTTPTETEGPFPTHTPASWVRKDITSGKMGVTMATNITIKNKNASCAALAGAIVDIWHCDADGNYSEYGGSGMQATNYTTVSFLRGRQTTDANGLAAFTTIFPGWYNGRAVHIHVHIYDKTGKSLLVTQIAFPANVCDALYTSATTIYKNGKSTTTNEKDNVFSDGFTTELATVSGSVKDGYVLDHTIVVNG